MKIPALILGLVAIIPGIGATDWKIGTSLKGAASRLTSADFFSQENLGFWPEDQITLYSLPDGAKLMFSKNYYPFGVLTQIDGKYTFLVDYNGDSVLDCSPENLFVPPWVVDLTSKGTDSGEQIVELYEKKFDSFNGDELPSGSATMREFAERLVAIAKDENAADRIYVYFDYLYDVGYNRKEFEIAEASLLNIQNVTSKTTKSRSAWLIEAVERAYKVQDVLKAKKYDDELVRLSPEFAPGLYYQYLFETEQDLKEQMRIRLLKNHSTHWLVKDRFRGESTN